MISLVRLLLALAGLTAGTVAYAHELQTAALRLNESAGGQVTATLNTPLARDGQPATVVPVFDARCAIVGDSRVEREAARVIRDWRLQCRDGLDGTRLRFEGLDPRTPEALVTVNFSNGVSRTLALDRHDPSILLRAVSNRARAAGLTAYLPLGIEHILLGPDHLLFVFGLMLVVSATGGGWRRLVAALTAFTLAHSLTLGLAMFGIWGLPPKPVEILIALSIVLLAVELSGHARRQARGLGPTLTLRKPWLVAFMFGLLHGFGFAGALSEIGLPEAARGWALLLFNLGVEIGQLLFIAGVLLLIAIGRRWIPRLNIQTSAITIALGAIAVYWTLDRTAIWLQAGAAIRHLGA
jgi:hypothetical protein